MRQAAVHDFIAIGLGPFNLSLACLAEPVDGLNGAFLEQRAGFDWHPGMLLDGAGMQTPFLADLVSLADPTSRFSFLNYLKQQGRLYPFYIRENFFPLRAEFNDYCQWAARQLPSIHFQRRVERIDWQDGVYRLSVRHGGEMETWLAHKLVLGTGTVPSLPACCDGLGERVIHSADYLANKLRLQMQPSITVLGSGQSAAEIYFDLLQDIDRFGYRLDWITRSPRFYPLEYTKLTLEMTSPEYIDYFHALPTARRDRLIESQKGLYKGINRTLIDQIFDLLYQKRLQGGCDTRLMTNTALTACRDHGGRAGLTLDLLQCEQQQAFSLDTARLVAATGYEYRQPACLAGIEDRLRRDAQGRLDVTRDYAVDSAGREIFVQNVGLYSHGLATPDLGMACYRNACLLRALTGREIYPVETRIAFQTFGVPDARLPQDHACLA
ncbi:lysine N(6)-hydroxylase/L-ornithine N(5)-oxygenase family protein [Paludibacterium purpuratum]|uniref:Lysine N6-hydroxylase n=1 Tax=Paludibacterium purpuratum TaxID=1144873 RepID=A0A4V3DVZ3_9NEIS|nr:lysine N(6)-hydroxylase/L-ornithine N(5)-oxygenase family protein [Paludibacterium purpuratum]TDR82849.1 lysine N6-hydroxylase [Paludibacterium purpuratum]